jgi:hypothetical protein
LQLIWFWTGRTTQNIDIFAKKLDMDQNYCWDFWDSHTVININLECSKPAATDLGKCPFSKQYGKKVNLYFQQSIKFYTQRSQMNFPSLRALHNTFWWVVRGEGGWAECSYGWCADVSLCRAQRSSAGEKWRKIMKSGWLLRHNAHTARRIVSSSQCSLCETSHVSHSDDDAREREKSTQARSSQRCTFISCEFHVIYFFAARARENLQLPACVYLRYAREDPCYTHFSLSLRSALSAFILLYKVRAWRVVYLRPGRQMPSMEANWKENWRAMPMATDQTQSSLFRPLMAPQIESLHLSNADWWA